MMWLDQLAAQRLAELKLLPKKIVTFEDQVYVSYYNGDTWLGSGRLINKWIFTASRSCSVGNIRIKYHEFVFVHYFTPINLNANDSMEVTPNEYFLKDVQNTFYDLSEFYSENTGQSVQVLWKLIGLCCLAVSGNNHMTLKKCENCQHFQGLKSKRILEFGHCGYHNISTTSMHVCDLFERLDK